MTEKTTIQYDLYTSIQESESHNQGLQRGCDIYARDFPDIPSIL